MKLRLFPLLAAVALMVVSACGGEPAAPVKLAIVPNPVSVETGGRGAKATANVKTRIDAKLAPEEYELRVKNGNLIAGRERIRFPEALSAGNIDVKEMHLAMLSDLPSFAVKDISCVVDMPFFISFRHASRR